MSDVDSIEAATSELYAGDREDFVARRRVLVRRVRESGRADLAWEIGALRKPGVAAWALDQAARRTPEPINEVAALGEEIRAALAAGSRGDDLRALLARRAAVVVRARDAAVEVIRATGGSPSVSTTQQIEGTLRAAIASPDVAQLLVEGRLVDPVSEVDLGVGLVGAGPTSGSDASARSTTGSAGGGRDAARTAARELRDAERDVAESTSRRDQLARRVDRARAELDRLERELSNAEGELRDAVAHRDDLAHRAVGQ